MLNLNNKPGTLLAVESGGAVRKTVSFLKRAVVIALFCALGFTLSAPTLVQAEDLQEGTLAGQPSTNVQPVNTADPAELKTSAALENKAATKANTRSSDGLEISPEYVERAVGAGEVKAPTINKVFYDATTISGGKVHKVRVKVGKNWVTEIATVHVTLKAKDGTVKANLSVTPKSGNTWKVDLPAGKKVEEGDTVTVYQQLGEDTSPEVTANAQPSKALENKDKLQMPSGEIWIELTSSSLVTEDEQAEAIEMFKKVNTEIAGDIESVKFSINGTEHAYYEVTYTDKSTSGKIEATKLKIKEVKEYSAAPTIQKVQVTDGQIIVTLEKEVSSGTKYYFISDFKDGEDKNFNPGGKCKVDKSTVKEMSQAVSVDGTKVTFSIKDNDLKLAREFGITVKEPHKFRSCAKSDPVPTVPAKVEVRDPHKLTKADKTAIDKAIREANTKNGVSKLPDGTGLSVGGVPAIIEFDNAGNVTIISPNDVEGSRVNGKWVLAQNDDGTYKVKSGSKVFKIPAKDLVKNIAPKSPAIAVDTGKGEVTITPPAYENPGDDTDLASYTFTYTDASGAKQTGMVTRTVDGVGKTTWSSDDATVDANTGVITLKVEDIEVGGTVKATAKDNGGLIPEEKPLDSEPANKKLETATVSYDRNGGKGEMTGKTVNKGAEYEILANAFTAPENEKFKTWQIGTTEHKAKDKIRVKENTTIKAIWQDIEVKVSYSPNGGSGNMDSATMKKGSKYTVLPNGFTAPDDTQEFDTWEIDGNKVAAGKEIVVTKDTVVKAVWKKIPVKVSYDGNGGKGTMEGKTLDKGSKYTLLESSFKAPDDTQEFDTWEIDGNKVAAGKEIVVNKDTVVKAVWKKIQVKVSYDGNGGKGTMEGKTLDKGSKYTLLESSFKAPDDTQEFDTWEIDGNKVAAGKEIVVTKDTVVKAVWKKIQVKVSYDGNGGKGTMETKTVDKGSTYKLLASAFTAPENKEFSGWEVNGHTYKVGDSITVNGDVTVKALWKNKPAPSSTTPGNQKPGNQAKPQPKPQAQNPAAAGKLSQTGADGIYSLYASLLLLATGGLFVISRRQRNQR